MSAPVRPDENLRRLCLWGAAALFLFMVLLNLRDHPLSGLYTQIDEQAHVSYALHLVEEDRWWPDFLHFRIYDTGVAKPTPAPNYLNHPPTFYWLVKLLHAASPAFDITCYRYLTCAMLVFSMLLYVRIGLQIGVPLAGTIAYALLPFLVYAYLQVGFFNNDAAALLGGMMATYGSLRWFARVRPSVAFIWMLGGLALASVKLTSFLLVGLYVLGCLFPRSQRTQLTLRHRLMLLLVFAVLLLPYVGMVMHTGHLVPMTPGQRAIMTHAGAGVEWFNVPVAGWVQQPRMDFAPWLGTFLTNFGHQLGSFETTGVALLMILGSFAYAALGLRPHDAAGTSSMRYVISACGWATVITLIVHIAYSWSRYQHYGWLMDSLVRYYFPLMGAYGILIAHGTMTLLRKKETL